MQHVQEICQKDETNTKRKLIQLKTIKLTDSPHEKEPKYNKAARQITNILLHHTKIRDSELKHRVTKYARKENIAAYPQIESEENSSAPQTTNATKITTKIHQTTD